MAQIDDPRKIRLVEWLLAKQIGEHSPATKQELADELNVDRRTLYNWEREPAVADRLRELAVQVAGDPERIRQLMDAMFDQALDSESTKQVQAASLIAKMLGLTEKKQEQSADKRKELLELSTEELDRIAAQLVAEQS